jgi:hypothetical protein
MLDGTQKGTQMPTPRTTPPPAMPTPADVAAQIAFEVGEQLDPIIALIGHHHAGPITTMSDALHREIAGRADEWADRLLDHTDPHRNALARTIMRAINPWGVGRLSWWRTPLGLAIAPAIIPTLSDLDTVSHADAAAILGVHRGTVARLSRGAIDRNPEGSLLLASVLTRLIRQTMVADAVSTASAVVAPATVTGVGLTGDIGD